MNATVSLPVRTIIDRCVRCGAAAKVRVTLRPAGMLHFCGHHARVHEAKLRTLSDVVLSDVAPRG